MSGLKFNEWIGDAPTMFSVATRSFVIERLMPRFLCAFRGSFTSNFKRTRLRASRVLPHSIAVIFFEM